MNALVSEFRIDTAPALIGDAGPFTLSCVGETVTRDPELGCYPTPASIQIGRFRSFAEAVACAKRRGRQSDLCVDAFQSFAPNLLTIMDRHQRLCLGGQITATGLIWCASVISDAEARAVVLEASGLRSRAMTASDHGDDEGACELRFQAAALEARLIDPVWRFANPVRAARAA